MGSGRPSSQWEVLAVARCILAVGVMIWHLHEAPQHRGWWTAVGIYLGQTSAVWGFLIISGYSIAASLDRGEQGFLWRRVRRIYPVYLASIGLALVINVSGGVHQPALIYVLMLAMLQTIIVPTIANDGQLWSLAAEWWNYVLAPLYRRVPDICLWALMALSFGAFFAFAFPQWIAFSLHGLVIAQISWLWLLGFLAYRHRGTVLGAAALVGPPLLALAIDSHKIGSAVWIAVAALVLSDRITLPGRWRSTCRWLGDVSYPIYAMQVPVFVACGAWGINSPGLISAAVILVAVLVLHGLDLPVRSIKPTRSRSPEGVVLSVEA